MRYIERKQKKNCKRKIVIRKYKKEIIALSLIAEKIPKEKVVGYIKPNSLSKESRENKTDVICVLSENKVPYFFEVKESSNMPVVGYIQVDDDQYIAYTKNFKTIIPIILLIGCCLAGNLFIPEQEIIDKIDEITDSLTNGITDMGDLLHGKGSVGTLSVPQFSELYISSENYVPLINLPQNSILMMYEVYSADNELVFSSKKPIAPNSEDRWYLSDYESGDYTFTIVAYKVSSDGQKGNSVSFSTILHIY